MATTGLNDFLKHIKNNPQNDTLIDRFMALVVELEAKSRRLYLEKLFAILQISNPHGTLRAAYFHLQVTRSESPGTLWEVEALAVVEQAFVLLGKNQHASLVKVERERLKKLLPPPLPERRKKKTLVETPVKSTKELDRKTQVGSLKPAKAEEKKAAELRFTTQREDFIASLYESFASQLLEALAKQVMSYQGAIKAEPAAAHIIKSFRHIYAEMSSTLRNARAVFGHNPLLFDEKDQFREDLIQVFLRSPIFSKRNDPIAAQRVRLVASLMIAWFDQQQSLPASPQSAEHERLQNKLLEIAIGSVLLMED